MSIGSRNPGGSRPLRQATLLFSLLAAAGLAAGPVLAHGGGHDDDRDRDGPVVKTVEGPVRGFKKDGVETYLGIPYAAPPVGDLRWRPPQPIKKWKETIDATEFGNICP